MSKPKSASLSSNVVENDQLLIAVKIVKIGNNMLGIMFINFEYEVGFAVVSREFIKNVSALDAALKGALLSHKEKGVEIGIDNTELALTMIQYLKQIIEVYNIDDEFMKAKVDVVKLRRQLTLTEDLAQGLAVNLDIVANRKDYHTYITIPFKDIDVVTYVLLDVEFNPHLTNVFCIIDRFVTITATDAIKTSIALDSGDDIGIVPARVLFPRNWLPLIVCYKPKYVGDTI